MATYGYLRVSTDQQCLENQRSEILRFAKSHGLVIDKWVSETVSGTVKGSDRKLGRLIKRLKKGDIIVISELSRLSRTMLDIMFIMKTLIEKKVKLYSTKENFVLDDDISSKVVIFAFSLASEIERGLISARTKEALAARKEMGMVLGRKTGDCPKMRILESNREEILLSWRNGAQIRSLCKEYGVSESTMRKFLNAEAKRQVGLNSSSTSS